MAPAVGIASQTGNHVAVDRQKQHQQGNRLIAALTFGLSCAESAVSYCSSRL